MERKMILLGWPGPWAVFAANYTRKNYWKIRNIVDSEEDAMSECRLMYAECRHRYAHSVNSPKQFMYLYRMAVVGRFIDLAKRDTRRRTLLENYQPATVSSVNDTVSLGLRLRSASQELRTVICILQNAPAEALQVMLSKRNDPVFMFRSIMKTIGITNTTAEKLLAELETTLG